MPKAHLCLAIALGAFAPLSLRAAPAPTVLHDAVVVTDSVLVRGTRATVAVEVTGARSLRTSDPLAGARVTATLQRAPAEQDKAAEKHPAVPLGSAVTDGRGSAIIGFRVPAVEPGDYRLRVHTQSDHGESHHDRPVTVEDALLVHLRTDRPVYKPGQSIRWRVTGLSSHNASAQRVPVEVTVRDPRGTAIWRGTSKLAAGGMAAGQIDLGEDLVLGTYTITAALRSSQQSESFEVREFRYPSFDVQLSGRLSSDGRRYLGRVAASYRYGEPVRGQVVLGSGDEPSRRRARLDPNGQLAFSLPLSPGDRSVVVSVTDGAGRTERRQRVVARNRSELRLAIVPEQQGRLGAGTEQRFTIVTSDGAGHLRPARVFVRSNDDERTAIDSPGAVQVSLTMPDRAGAVRIEANAISKDGAMATGYHSLYLQEGLPDLRLSATIVQAGDPVRIAGTWPGPRGLLLVTLLKGDAPIASTMVTARNGAVSARLVPPPGTFGLATIRVVELGWTRDDPDQVRSYARNLYLHPARLDVAIDAGTRYRPGGSAAIDVTVRDRRGKPVPGVALAASVIDERALALGEPRPDLVRVLHRLDSIDDATRLGLVFGDLLDDPPLPERDAALTAILQALPVASSAPRFEMPAAQRYAAERERLDRAQRAVVPALLVHPGQLGDRDQQGRWRYQTELSDWLIKAGWKQADVRTPWRQPTTWSYAIDVVPGLAFDQQAHSIARRRLDALHQALRARRGTRKLLVERGSAALAIIDQRSSAVASYMRIDPWGNPIEVEAVGGPLHPTQSTTQIDLVSPGPDLRLGTRDDVRVSDIYTELGIYGTIGHGSGAGGIGFGRGSASPSIRMGSVGVTGDPAPLRKRFDETVLWTVGVITGEDGAARLDVELADSITGWKVAVEAVGPGGSVGTAQSRLETFLPLAADAQLPASLAVGDQYRVPITIDNHSGKDQRLIIDATSKGGLAITGKSRHLVALKKAHGGVVYLHTRATAAGQAALRIALSDGQRQVDRIQRSITIEPPGARVRTISAGEVSNGSASMTVEVPDEIAGGSARGTLRIFRGAADQALEGLEGMLREPNGCFEQTSSATYPNLLVLRLIKNAPGMEAVRKRAKSMVGRGYQRLISYEVRGGGFSWFGQAPANQVLTAYGLMEFADMSAVYPVDPALIDRTQKWLLSRQRKDGSWQPDKTWLHDWDAVQGSVSTTAYIAWSLAESGYRGPGLTRALGFLRRHASQMRADPYVLGLWAATESATGREARRALALLEKHGSDTDDGRVYRSGNTTLFYASGTSADTQVTALATTALVRSGKRKQAERALDWLWQARSPNYGWGTTQSTVLALRAAALAETEPPPREGILTVSMAGKVLGTIDLSAVEVPSLDLGRLDPGRHRLTITGSVVGDLKSDLRLSWREQAAGRATDAGLSVALTAPQVRIPLGSDVPMAVWVKNSGTETVAMPTIVIPVPPGFATDGDSLVRLRRNGRVSKVEDLGSSIAVYLEELAAGQSLRVDYTLRAESEVDVLQRSVQAYAYYSPELRGHSDSLRLRTSNQVAPLRRQAGGQVSAGLRSPPRGVWW